MTSEGIYLAETISGDLYDKMDWTEILNRTFKNYILSKFSLKNLL